MLKARFLFLLMLCAVELTYAQTDTPATASAKPTVATTSPGEFYFSWGYNRESYSKSDIHIYRHDADPSKSYDFMLYDATAHDKPDMWRWWEPSRLTIPQYDLNVGYFFKNKSGLGVEIGWNHLKYVVTDWQTLHMKGQVHGKYFDAVQPLNPDTLIHLQHTNGNNYLLFSVIKRHQLWAKQQFNVSAIGKAGVGPLISYTIDKILGDQDPGYFHYHGYVIATSVGVRATYKRFFFQTDVQGGFADYTNTKLGHEHLGTAKHHFYSLQWTYEIGFTFPTKSKVQ